MPAPSGLHAKLLREASELSPYTVMHPDTGQPNHVRVIRARGRLATEVYHGHRDLLPACYRLARDPNGLLSRPASD